MKNSVKSIIISLAIIIAGCGGKKADEKSFIIHGKFTNTKKDSIYLQELTVKKLIGVDSAVISEDGDFFFKVKPKKIGFYLLKINRNNFITLLIDKGENVEISADARQMLRTYEVSGSHGSEIIKELNQNLQKNYDKVDSLSKVFRESQDKPDFLEIKKSLDSTYKLIFMEQKNFVKKFVDKNTNSLACLIAIYQQFGRESLFSFNNKSDFEYFEKVDKALMNIDAENEHIKDLHERVSEIKRIEAEKQLAENKLEIGSEAPDFTLNTPEGKSVQLSSFKGKFLLIDFWASWCAPCRQENPHMVKLYKQSKNKDFAILSVSFDRDKESWMNAIITDKLTWTQVSDLKYWSSPIAKLYNIEGIPYTVLLDKEGKIIAKGLRGEELAKKIEEAVK